MIAIQDIIETLGEIVESCMNYAEYGTKPIHPALSGLPEDMRIDALSNGLADAQKRIMDLYTELGGDDVWSMGS